MKNFRLIAAVFALALFSPYSAEALSTEQGDAQNSDGSSKYTDPDEQSPGFIVSPGNGVSAFSGASVVTMPAPGDNDPGATAFDQAFAHQQDKQ